jgi:hypothetical protein
MVLCMAHSLLIWGSLSSSGQVSSNSGGICCAGSDKVERLLDMVRQESGRARKGRQRRGLLIAEKN